MEVLMLLTEEINDHVLDICLNNSFLKAVLHFEIGKVSVLEFRLFIDRCAVFADFMKYILFLKWSSSKIPYAWEFLRIR